MASGGEANKLTDLGRTLTGTDEKPLIGSSPSFQQLLRVIDAVAANDCAVLLEGESGTGKELLARRVHDQSDRANGPFIPVNCPAVAESLFESQFYGHMKGSFTGAAGDTLGMVRAAEGGTLFLDEIGELPLHLQPKLLRLLQEKEVTPVGGTEAVKVNVRFVAATNRSLARAVQDGKFRRDLYHRLNVVRLQIPSLRTRPDDIDELVDHFIGLYAEEYGKVAIEVDEWIRQSLREYSWHGNVRELSGWVERLYATGLPPMAPQPEIWDDLYATGEPVNVSEAPLNDRFAEAPAMVSMGQAEADAIESALRNAAGNKSAAAKTLNIHRTTLMRKMKQYSL